MTDPHGHPTHFARGLWLRFLDRVKPRPGIGGPSPRIHVASPAEAKRIEEILSKRPDRMMIQEYCDCTHGPCWCSVRRSANQEPDA